MIIRKPYAFLIKNFKLIHLIISVIIIYLITKTNNILIFFKRYLQNSLISVDVNVSFLSFFSIILIILLSVIIIMLLKKKKKPILFYIITVILYSVVFIGFIYLSTTISDLSMKVLDRKTISFVRDITRFILYGQVLILIPYIIRTLGFDIKKFDFKKDLEELNIDVTDNEEYELTIGVDKNKLEQKGRRRLRELKYYYLENKLFILIILGVVFAIVLYNIISSISITKTYKEGVKFDMDNFYSITITDSYITSFDNNGNDVSVNDNTYLIVKFNINSYYNGSFSLDTNKFIVKIKNNDYIANKTYYPYFTNYGIGYKEQKIKLNDSKDYILTYSIPKDYVDKKITLVYNYRFDNDNNMIKKIIKLSPEVIK